MGPYCSKFDVTFSLIDFKRPENSHHWDKTSGRVIFSNKPPSWLKLIVLQSPIKAPTGTSIPHKISFFIQQGNISYQNDISQKL